MDVIIGSEAIASGALTRGQLRWNYSAVHPDVYVATNRRRTWWTDTEAAWLWTGRTGIIAGCAAASYHGVRGIGVPDPIEMIAGRSRRGRGVLLRNERIDPDEVQTFGSGTMRITTPARTALDLGRHLPRDQAVRYLDELSRVSGVRYADVEPLLARYRGARELQRARTALRLMDGGAYSPEETRLRLILADGGLPPPRTNITLGEGPAAAIIALGWDRARLGVSVYDGSSHEGCIAIQETRRLDTVHRFGWIEMQVADLSRRSSIVWRVRDALRRRGLRT